MYSKTLIIENFNFIFELVILGIILMAFIYKDLLNFFDWNFSYN